MQTLGRWARSAQVVVESADAVMRRAQAYEAVFSGVGSKEDAEIVLADLALVTGYYSVATATASSQSIHYVEGARSVFHHILGLIGNPAIIGELHNAVINEQLKDT